MARPLRKGPPIGFRLPLDLHAQLERLAEAKDMTPSQWVAVKIAEALSKTLPRTP